MPIVCGAPDRTKCGTGFQPVESQANNPSRTALLQFLGILPVLAFCVAPTLLIAAGPLQTGAGLDYRTDKIIVRFAPHITQGVARRRGAKTARGAAKHVAGEPKGLTDQLRQVCHKWGVHRMRRLHAGPFKDPALAAQLGLDRTFVIEVPAGTKTPDMVKEFAAFAAEVEVAEVDGIVRATGQLIPDDASFCQQYNMHNTGLDCFNFSRGIADSDVDAPEAWALHTGDPGTVTIAIVDSGVTPHTDLADRLVPGQNILDPSNPNNTVDLCSLFGGLSGHGTHVAGIAAATGNNGIGVAGMSWGANIMPVRVLDGSCTGSLCDVADGIRWAADNGADIINLSVEIPFDFAAIKNAVDYAHGLGVLLVSAAGNSNIQAIAFPARYPNSMAVAATNSADLRWVTSPGLGSNRCNPMDVCELDVAAPGQNIFSTYRNGTWGLLTGTSMATPHVSGLAALIMSFAPALTADEVRAIITSTADDLGTAGFDIEFGFGRINAHQALLAAPMRIAASDPPSGAIDARQPVEPDGTDVLGWFAFDMTFMGTIVSLDELDFDVTQDGGLGPTPIVVAVADKGGGLFRVFLNREIPVKGWTTITHIDSGTFVRVGHLPGDVDASGTTDLADLTALIDDIGGPSALPLWSTDIDQSGGVSPADIPRLIDLLMSGEIFEMYLGQSLPTLP